MDADEFGAERLTFLETWIEARAEMILKVAGDVTLADLVASAAAAEVADLWVRFPACRALIADRMWHRYLDEVTDLFVRRLAFPADERPPRPGAGPAAQPGDAAAADHLEGRAASTIDGKPLLKIEEQIFIHLRYRLGLKVPDIARVMDLELRRTRDIGRSAHRVLGDDLRRM